MSDLKPCPGCGASNKEHDNYPLMIAHDPLTIKRPAYKVICDNCGTSSGWSDRGDHIENWNTRYIPEGYTLVPNKLLYTVDGMCAEYADENYGNAKEWIRHVFNEYQAMLEAAEED